MHKEQNKPNIQDKNNNYLIICRENQTKTDKFEESLKFINDFNSKVNSIISSNFQGLMKSVNFCTICNYKTYSFSSFFFVTFNLETILKNSKISVINIEEQFSFQNQNLIQSYIHCSQCLNKTKHGGFKQFFSLPNLLVISIQRGIKYDYKTPVDIKTTLNLNNPALFQYSKNIYNLVGILGRYVKDGNEIFFSVINIGNNWFNCDGTDIKQVNSPLNYNKEGDIIMLFYN